MAEGCGAKGDGLSLLACVDHGRPEWDRTHADSMRALSESAGLTDGDRGEPMRKQRRPLPPKPQPVVEDSRVATEARVLWECCQHIDADPACSRWLQSRGIEPEAVGYLDLARALPAIPPDPVPAWLPEWARHGRSPWPNGWRVIVPCYGPDGRVRRVRARWIHEHRPQWVISTSPGTGIQAGPAVMANSAARYLLERGRPAVPGDRWDGTVVIVEGEPDYLTACQHAETSAVFGVFAGAWSKAIASRLSLVARVWLAVDADAAGESYAEKIQATLPMRAGRLVVRRQGADWNDLGRFPWAEVRG